MTFKNESFLRNLDLFLNVTNGRLLVPTIKNNLFTHEFLQDRLGTKEQVFLLPERYYVHRVSVPRESYFSLGNGVIPLP